MTHAGHRLVQEHHLGIERQRGSDFERALAPIRHLDRGRAGEFVQAHIVQQFQRAAVEAVEHRLGAPEIEGVAMLALQRDPHVFQRSEMREDCRDLKRADQPEPRHIGRRHRRDVLSLVEDFAG